MRITSAPFQRLHRLLMVHNFRSHLPQQNISFLTKAKERVQRGYTMATRHAN